MLYSHNVRIGTFGQLQLDYDGRKTVMHCGFAVVFSLKTERHYCKIVEAANGISHLLIRLKCCDLTALLLSLYCILPPFTIMLSPLLTWQFGLYLSSICLQTYRPNI